MTKSTTLAKTVAAILIFSLVLVGIPAGDVAASNGDNTLSIDVWTSKGGQGPVALGGTFQVGEETIIYVRATVTVQARWTISGPSATNSGAQLLEGGETYMLALGQAEEVDIGQWQFAFEGEIPGQGAYDRVSFNVVSSAPASTSTPPVSSPPTVVEEETARIDAASATELAALIALKMAEGKLATDLYMDADGDGRVTKEDANLILDWVVGSPGGLSSQAVAEESQPALSATLPGGADQQALVGKWRMIRLKIPPEVPDEIPEWVVNMVIPKEATWEIFRDGEQLKIKYDGRDTWYRKTLLGGIREGATVARQGQDGTSCVFETDCTFSYDSLLFGIGLIYRNIKQIRGSFTSKVSLALSGTGLDVTITVDNVDGTYYEKGDDGQMKQKSINFAGTAVKYRGFKKE
jgi:hypothetical protein